MLKLEGFGLQEAESKDLHINTTVSPSGLMAATST